MAITIPPIVQEVTTAEALQSGALAKKQLSAVEQKKLNNFIRAHAQRNSSGEPPVEVTQKNRLEGKPQVTAEEQAIAVAARSREDAHAKRASEKYKEAYRVMFTSDMTFLSKDLISLNTAVKTKSKSLVDLAGNLRPEEKALRKFLLVSLLLEEPGLSKTEIKDLNTYKKSLNSEHGDFISGSISAFEVGKQSRLSQATLREFIKAYQTIEIQPHVDAPDILSLFKAIRNNVTKEDFSADMNKMRDGFINILSREKTQNPKKITAPRHYMILSRINQINLLIKAQGIHKKFLNCCTAAKLSGLPSLSNLLESCLQTVASAEVVTGLNSLVRIASAVSANNRPGKNIFITNYNRLVLKSDLLEDLYKNGSHRKQVTDGIDKNLKAAGVLSVGASHAQS
ncbi:conserved hypothetical protein [Limnobacter sp. 130]|uniref:hypothetical protein n=2 Tax=unclassified Limnobacter TaxID=2630203 RepID=UPI0012F316E5|nr:hypothetical protein [Limnobacter sp. 130]VWX34786.1 conserved hypothetical protein [Limnobacter sp. 130]